MADKMHTYMYIFVCVLYVLPRHIAHNQNNVIAALRLVHYLQLLLHLLNLSEMVNSNMINYTEPYVHEYRLALVEFLNY